MKNKKIDFEFTHKNSLRKQIKERAMQSMAKYSHKIQMDMRRQLIHNLIDYLIDLENPKLDEVLDKGFTREQLRHYDMAEHGVGMYV